MKVLINPNPYLKMSFKAQQKFGGRDAPLPEEMEIINAFRQGWLEKWKRNEWYRDAKRKEKAKNRG